MKFENNFRLITWIRRKEYVKRKNKLIRISAAPQILVRRTQNQDNFVIYDKIITVGIKTVPCVVCWNKNVIRYTTHVLVMG